MIKLHILEITTGLEVHAVRYAAEHWGMSVTVTWVGNSGQLVDFLSSSPEHDIILISGHGDERGLLLPELAEAVAANYPYHQVVRQTDFAEFLSLKDNVVINSSCMGGVQGMAEVFLAKGAKAYLAPKDFPSASISLMYLLGFLYAYMSNDGDVDKAHAFALLGDEQEQFTLFKKE